MKYFDTHAHLNTQYFKDNIEEAIIEAKNQGVEKIALPGTTPNDSLSNIEFAERHDNIFAMAGVHPTDSEKHNSDYLNKVDPNKIIAVGEIGLDFYRANNPARDLQIKNFIAHLDFAVKHNKPVVIHMRNAEKDTFEILSKYAKKGVKILMHSYTGSTEWAKKFMSINAYFSFSGIVTFKNAGELKEVAKMIPRDKIVVETDSPFLSPEPVRGKSNKPVNVRFVAQYIAYLRKDDAIIEKLYENAMSFFGL